MPHLAPCSMLRSFSVPGLVPRLRILPGRRMASASAPLASTLDPPLTAKEELELLVASSLSRCFGKDVASNPGPCIAVPPRLDLGDFQSNAAMPLAKRLGRAPRDVAETLQKDLVAHGALSFVSNISLAARKLRRMLECASSDGAPGGAGQQQVRAGGGDREELPLLRDLRAVQPARDAGVKRVLVDFSSPNIAKEMHVGHLRSTIIGDCLARLHEALGYTVIRINHVGDWGTQFGMLILHMKRNRPSLFEKIVRGFNQSAADSVERLDLVHFYKAARREFDDNQMNFQELCRREVVALQNGNSDSIAVWRYLCALSREEFQKIYDVLKVRIEERGESFYNPHLSVLLEDLAQAGLVTRSEGALVFKPPDTTAELDFSHGADTIEGGRRVDPALMLQKSDGGFLYASTDLAAIRYRFAPSGDAADRVLYVTDSGQALHFKKLFEAAHVAGFVPPGKEARHVPFGLVLGEDGKKLKSRSGDTVLLSSLLQESVDHAEQVIRSKLIDRDGGDLEATVLRDRAGLLGVAAVKYADLSMHRESNYRYSPSKMMSLTGNTAPYILYALVRIRSIIRKLRGEPQLSSMAGYPWSEGNSDLKNLVAISEEVGVDADAWIQLGPAEDDLARRLVGFDDVLLDAQRSLQPHKMCEYLFDLSQSFSSFYEACPVLLAQDPQTRRVREVLCLVTEAVIHTYLAILGIEELDEL